ncbi:hemagglutinin repeat-containing protein [Halomonas cupida]|uniref:hemagglutinin repeat-containing protein n=1 Tax=Halomonas cupida TaxID=44933 RepID=UPI0039B5EA0E
MQRLITEQIKQLTGQRTVTVTNAPSQVTAGGNVDIQAGSDISLVGSRVEAGGGAPRTPDESSPTRGEDAEGGNIRLSAGRDITLSPGTSGSDQQQWESESRYGISFDSDENSVSVFVGRESEAEGHGLASQQSVGSELSASGNVEVNAGRDITQVGGRTSAGEDITYTAERNMNLLSGSNTERTTETHEQTRSGFGTSVNHNFGNARDAIQGAGEGDNTVSQASSTLKAVDTVSRTAAGPTFSGSLGRSGEDIRVTGEDVRAAPAELNAGGSVSIGAGKDATLEGTRVNAGEDILVEADNIFVRPGAESASQQTEARHEWSGIRQEGNSVGGGASLGVDTADIEQTSGAGAQLAAGGDVDLIAEDALRIEGSDVAAGNDVRLEGTTVDIVAFQGDYSEVHDGEQIGGEVGITAGGEGGTLGYYVEVEGGQNDLVRDDQQHRNSRITAGDRLEVVSTDDATISGANLTGNELDLDVGGDLLVSSVQDEGAVDGQRWDGKLRVTVGAGVSVSGSAGYGETEGEKAWVADQTRLIGRERVDIDTVGHTQVDGAVIANVREDGSDGGNLSLTTDTLAVTDIHDSHTEDSHYTRISGSWESEKAYQSRGSDSDYTQTTGKPRGDETGDTLDERTTWGIEGSYSSLDREQINRGTIGQGEITVHHPDSDLNTELADINRDIDRAQEITRDESETTELYVTETSVEDAANPVDTVNRWGEQLQNLPQKYIELPQEVKDNYVQLERGLTALATDAPEDSVAAFETMLAIADPNADGTGITDKIYDTLILRYGKDAADQAMEGLKALDNPVSRTLMELHREDPEKAREVLTALREVLPEDNDSSALDQRWAAISTTCSRAPSVCGAVAGTIGMGASGTTDSGQQPVVSDDTDMAIVSTCMLIPSCLGLMEMAVPSIAADGELADGSRTEYPAEAGQLPAIPGYPAENESQVTSTEYPTYDIDRPGRYETPVVDGQTGQTSAGGYQPAGTELIGGAVYSEGSDATNKRLPEGVSFGRNANQDYHVWRHVEDELGMSRQRVQDAVVADLPPVSNLSSGLNVRFVTVDGVRLQYNAFKLPDGTVNIGRIHEEN